MYKRLFGTPALPVLPALAIPLLGTLSGHTGGVRNIAFSPDGSMLASGSADASIKLWDIRALSPMLKAFHHIQ